MDTHQGQSWKSWSRIFHEQVWVKVPLELIFISLSIVVQNGAIDFGHLVDHVDRNWGWQLDVHHHSFVLLHPWHSSLVWHPQEQTLRVWSYGSCSTILPYYFGFPLLYWIYSGLPESGISCRVDGIITPISTTNALRLLQVEETVSILNVEPQPAPKKLLQLWSVAVAMADKQWDLEVLGFQLLRYPRRLWTWLHLSQRMLGAPSKSRSTKSV